MAKKNELSRDTFFFEFLYFIFQLLFREKRILVTSTFQDAEIRKAEVGK